MSGDKVKCAVCNNSFKKITGKHVKLHGLTFEEYVENYPNAPLVSEYSLRVKKESAIRANRSRKGVPRSDEVKRKIRATKSKQTIVAWNAGKPKTQAEKDHLSKIRTQAFADGTLKHWNEGKSTPDPIRSKISKTLLKKHEPDRLLKEQIKTDKHQKLIKKINSLQNNIQADVNHLITDQSSNCLRRLNSILTHQTLMDELDLSLLEISKPLKSLLTYKIRCNRCNNNFAITNQYFRDSKLENRQCDFCPICHPRMYKKSQGETELFNYISSFVHATSNNRTVLDGFELDIFLPDQQMAFEYTGNYWHSEQVHNSKYNVWEKHLMCQNKGIQLITIFEDEWGLNQNICKSRIRQKIGIKGERIHARKCDIRTISRKDTKEFLENTHIQGSDISKILYGAFFNEKLVAVMTFKPTNMSKGGNGADIELSRYAICPDVTCTGLANRLFSKFLNDHPNVNSVISYSDNRWNTGILYEHLGFTFEQNTPPSFWYITPGTCIRKHRSNYMKHILVKQGFDPHKTANEIMNERGFLRLWDAGTKKWKFNR